MRQTYTDLYNAFLFNTGNSSNSSTDLTSFFKLRLADRYQQAFSELTKYITQVPKTASTVSGQQYYHLPVGIVKGHSATVTVGSFPFPVIPVQSQLQWDYLNQVLLSVTAFPQYIFYRRDDFGVWPIPQAVYTITFNANIRDRSLGVADYTTNTVAVTYNSQTVVGTGTNWTAAMIGRWFVMNDTTQQGQGYWYRISGVTDTTHLTLETSYEGVSVSGATYRIGESPELPEEVHLALADGVTADYYSGPRSDTSKGTWFENKFWTGNGADKERSGKVFVGGVLGAKQRYASRDNGALVYRQGAIPSWSDRNWAASITD